MATSASRDTSTGTNYETEVENLLEEFSDHDVQSQVMVGAKRNGGRHYCDIVINGCLLYTSPSPRDRTRARMPSSA